ncbi:MAG: lipid-transfer protein [Actinomycetes bacterium]
MTRVYRKPVAIVAWAEFSTPLEPARNEVELLIPVIREAKNKVGLEQKDIHFTVSGSSDYLQGYPFAFVGALDAVGAWPPIRESHLEMDGAFALYEAVEFLQHDDIDTALVYAFARPSTSDLDRTLALQLDPYVVAPLWPDARSLAGLQAQAMRDSGRFAEVPDVAPTEVADGATAVILATGDRARELVDRPAWIRGIDHRIEAPALGVRDLTTSPSTRTAAEGAGALGVTADAAFLHTPYPHQELILREALQLNGTKVDAAAGPTMVGGLSRLVGAAGAIASGSAQTAIAHATAGACLQQNLVALLGADAA